MSTTPTLASPCFFSVARWHNPFPMVCDYSSIPRPHFGMSMVLKGSADIEVNGRVEKILPGEILFVPAGSQYISRWMKESCNYTILFSFFPHTQFPGDKQFEVQKISPQYEGEFTTLFADAYRDFDEAGGYQFSALSSFFGIMAKIMPRVTFSKKPQLDERIKRAVAHIEEYYKENTTTAHLAAIAHMSVSRFHVVFKAQTNKTPIEYRNSIRVRLAILALEKGETTMEELSEALGFESLTYFRRVFKKTVGCPPSQYKEKHKRL